MYPSATKSGALRQSPHLLKANVAIDEGKGRNEI